MGVSKTLGPGSIPGVSAKKWGSGEMVDAEWRL